MVTTPLSASRTSLKNTKGNTEASINPYDHFDNLSITFAPQKNVDEKKETLDEKDIPIQNNPPLFCYSSTGTATVVTGALPACVCAKCTSVQPLEESFSSEHPFRFVQKKRRTPLVRPNNPAV